MNPGQFAQQIKHLLEQARWPAGSQGLVFGARGHVVVFQGAPDSEQIPAGTPFALVHIDTGQHDPDDPSLMQQGFSVAVAAEAAGDPMGEHAIIGGAITDVGKSANRGVGAIVERARTAVQSLTGADGARILLGAAAVMPVQKIVEGARHLAFSAFELSAVCTAQPRYTAPQLLKNTAGVWTWNGSACSSRFDFLRYRLVRKSGTSPSSSPSDGTLLFTGTAATFTGAATAGNVYTVFADYSSRQKVALMDGSSSPVRGAYRVVTA